ncbi:MAG: FAD-dependent oxidoreductase, partial [Deltaproteobacteria bacterium]|nr:FAD-dependent oxidoreductase [Deltaproteobacteria bacterium]
MTYDICIIGGGPGGYSAAIKGAQLGAKVALVERESLGGTCLNHGCIPTKNLYSASELLRGLSEGAKFGIKISGANVEFPLMMERKNEVVDHLKSGLVRLFKDHKIDIFEGKGAIESAGKVRVDSPGSTEIIEAPKIIIATGSEAADIPPLRIDGRMVLGNREILQLTKIPEKLIVVG